VISAARSCEQTLQLLGTCGRLAGTDDSPRGIEYVGNAHARGRAVLGDYGEDFAMAESRPAALPQRRREAPERNLKNERPPKRKALWGVGSGL
jgi:hypothetical protein